MSKSFHDIPLPCIMGILNVTPDSFSDGEHFLIYENAEKHLAKLISEGASIIDIGGESTRPNAAKITWQEEWHRIEKILKFAVKNDSICISVDTYNLATADLALKSGANIINDVYGTMHFKEMAKVVKDFGAHIIVTHNSRNNDDFCNINDPVACILSDFDKVLEQAYNIGLNSDRIIFDPGIGFGKTHAQNLKIIKDLHKFSERFQNPILCAVSKKSVLSETLGSIIDRDLASATIASTVEAFRQGCQIFRVHNVAENLAALNLAKKIYE